MGVRQRAMSALSELAVDVVAHFVPHLAGRHLHRES